MAFADLLAAGDRAALRHLGSPIFYMPSFGDPAIAVTGVFDVEYVDVRPETGVARVGPAVFLLLADLVTAGGQLVDPTDSEDAVVTVAGVEYRVREARLDGQGGALFHLHGV